MYGFFRSCLVSQWWFLIFSSLLMCFFPRVMRYTSFCCCMQLGVQGSSLGQGSLVPVGVIGTTLLPPQNQTTTWLLWSGGQAPLREASRWLYVVVVCPRFSHWDASWCCAADVSDKLLTRVEASGANGADCRNHKFCKAEWGKVLQRRAFCSFGRTAERSSQRLCFVEDVFKFFAIVLRWLISMWPNGCGPSNSNQNTGRSVPWTDRLLLRTMARPLSSWCWRPSLFLFFF